MKTTVTEKFRLRKSLLGWFTIPCDCEHHPLLSQLQGDLPRAQWARIEHKDVKLAIAVIKEVAHSMGMSVQVCGNLKISPTVILRRHALPEEWTEPTSLPPAQNWRIRMCAVHGTSGYQVTHVRPEHSQHWRLSCQAPEALSQAIGLDLERLTLAGCDRSKAWDLMHGKASSLSLSECELKVVDSREGQLVLEASLAQPIPAGKTHRAFIHAPVDLKWCVFNEDAAGWADHGYGHVIEMMDSLVKGQTLTILSSASKECRRGRVHVQRTGNKAWKLSGAVSCDWDDVPELADTLGVCFEEDVGTDVPEDEDELIIFLAEFNAKQRTNYTAISSENVFRESVPMLWDTAEPGTEHVFDRRVRGDVAHLLTVMSKLEDEAMSRDEKIWSDLESSYRVTQLRDKPRPSVRGRIARAGEEGLVPAEDRRISP